MPKRRATTTSSSASRRSSLSRSAKSKKMGPSASAPANTIVLREEPPLHISFEVGSIVDADTEVVAVSCNSEVHMNNHIFAEVCKIGGTQIPSLIDAAKNALPRNALHSGQVVAVDVSETPLKPKHLLLVINPDGFHINMAWRGVLTKAQDLGCESIAVAGMGCGGLQVDPIKSATRFRTVVGEMLESGKFTTLKRISFRDVNQQLAATFENVFSQGLAAATNDSAGTEDAFSCYLNDVPANLVTKDENCVVCMDSLTDSGDNVVALKKCSHQFHKSCFAMMMNQGGTRKCPTCQIYFALPEGNMPRGSRMRFHYIRDRIQIEGGSGYIKLEYDIPGGIQGDEHLRPGTPFCGTQRTAYLPNTQEGKKVLRLLEKAFECRLTFTVGDSVTTGAQNVVVWNNIHHKTSLSGGPTSFGYPDPDYLARVTEELRNAGITEELLNQSA